MTCPGSCDAQNNGPRREATSGKHTTSPTRKGCNAGPKTAPHPKPCSGGGPRARPQKESPPPPPCTSPPCKDANTCAKCDDTQFGVQTSPPSQRPSPWHASVRAAGRDSVACPRQYQCRPPARGRQRGWGAAHMGARPPCTAYPPRQQPSLYKQNGAFLSMASQRGSQAELRATATPRGQDP